MEKKKIAFVCVHNSCRSQIAEALGNHLRGNDFECYSCGTETKQQINQDAVRLMKELYGIDMEETQYSKTYDKIPTPDIAISMGCDVGCPYIGKDFDDNWGLPDPTGQTQKTKTEKSKQKSIRRQQKPSQIISCSKHCQYHFMKDVGLERKPGIADTASGLGNTA